MYDSRSSHPHKGAHWPRSWKEMGEGDRIEWGTPRTRILATPAMERLAIDEGMADFAEMHADGSYAVPTPRPWGTLAERQAELDEAMRVRGARKALISAAVSLDEPAKPSKMTVPFVANGKRRAAKRPFSRMTAPQFDPALVSQTLSPSTSPSAQEMAIASAPWAQNLNRTNA